MKTTETNPFKSWRTTQQLTLEQLAEALGKPRSYTGNLSKLERGIQGYSDELLGDLAKVYGITKSDVLAGPTKKRKITSYKVMEPNVSELTLLRTLPIISWVQAGSMSDIDTLPEPHHGDWPEVRPSTKVGSRSWALKVEGDSMDDGTDNGIREGYIIICDPDRAPYPNAYVIAKDVATQQATFKKLVTDGGRWFLKPLNRSYPTIEIDDPKLRVIAVVTEAQPPAIRLG